MSSGANKVCVRCEREYPATREHFNLDAWKSDGLSGWCKGCKAENSRERWVAGKVSSNAKRAERRRAQRAGIEVPSALVPFDASPEGRPLCLAECGRPVGLTGPRRWAATCGDKACIRLRRQKGGAVGGRIAGKGRPLQKESA
jgi:hypothetical protein